MGLFVLLIIGGLCAWLVGYFISQRVHHLHNSTRPIVKHIPTIIIVAVLLGYYLYVLIQGARLNAVLDQFD